MKFTMDKMSTRGKLMMLPCIYCILLVFVRKHQLRNDSLSRPVACYAYELWPFFQHDQHIK